MIQPTPTILAWLCPYTGPTPDGRRLWWAHTTWDGDDRHITVVEQPPPEERQPDWQWSVDEQGYRVAPREDEER